MSYVLIWDLFYDVLLLSRNANIEQSKVSHYFNFYTTQMVLEGDLVLNGLEFYLAITPLYFHACLHGILI